jgi:hypothetical protein
LIGTTHKTTKKRYHENTKAKKREKEVEGVKDVQVVKIVKTVEDENLPPASPEGEADGGQASILLYKRGKRNRCESCLVGKAYG